MCTAIEFRDLQHRSDEILDDRARSGRGTQGRRPGSHLPRAVEDELDEERVEVGEMPV
jgi:hypothetical protein